MPLLKNSVILFEDDTKHNWSRFLTVVVGGSKPEIPSQTVADYTHTKTFLVHETTIRAHSPFFDAAMARSDWVEANTRTITLSEHTPDAFEVYLRWVYSHRINLDKIEDMAVARMRYSSILCQAYVLGDVLQDLDFKDAIIDALIDFRRTFHWVPHNEANYIYGNTLRNSPLRQFLVATSVDLNVCHSVGQEKWEDYHPAEFLRDVVARMDRKYCKHDGNDTLELHIEERAKSWYEDVVKNSCVWHEHGVGQCYKVKYGIAAAASRRRERSPTKGSK